MHPVNNGGILDSECPKGKHYFLYTKYFQSYTYHQSFLLYSKLFSISSSEDLVHVFKFRGLSTCIIFKKKYDYGFNLGYLFFHIDQQCKLHL